MQHYLEKYFRSLVSYSARFLAETVTAFIKMISWTYIKSTLFWSVSGNLTARAYLIFRFWEGAAGGIRTRWGGGRWRMLDQNTIKAGFIRLKVICLLGNWNTTKVFELNKRLSEDNQCVCRGECVCVWFGGGLLGHNWPLKYWRPLLTLLGFFFSFFFF